MQETNVVIATIMFYKHSEMIDSKTNGNNYTMLADDEKCQQSDVVFYSEI